MSDPLHDWKPEHEFYIGIDSDGCAFDSMELKHKECFAPTTIKYWKLQAVSKFAREAAEFVNLYSKWRGANRWPALLKVFDLLSDRPEVLKRGITPPTGEALRTFLKSDFPASNDGLVEYMAEHPSAELDQAMAWSLAVNDNIQDMVEGVPPFPNVRESLEKCGAFADMVVVSATPCDALEREWKEHDIEKFVRVIAGQEMGKKDEILKKTTVGRYPEHHVLMIGDAPGDLNAARSVNALFFPINPGNEEASWVQFLEEGADRFKNKTFAGAYEAELISEFEKLLPETPPWK